MANPRTGTAEAMVTLLRTAITAKGWSQAEFARRSGVTPKHVSDVFTGKAFPTLKLLDYWAFVLDSQWSIDLLEQSPHT